MIVSVIARSLRALLRDPDRSPRAAPTRSLSWPPMLRRRATLTAWQRTTRPTGCSPDPAWTQRALCGRPARTSGPNPKRAGTRRAAGTLPRWFRTDGPSSGSSRATWNPSRSGGSKPTRSASGHRSRPGAARGRAVRPDRRANRGCGRAARAFGRADQAPRHPFDARRDDDRSGRRADAQPHVDEHVEQLGLDFKRARARLKPESTLGAGGNSYHHPYPNSTDGSWRTGTRGPQVPVLPA